jgi:hypothetical protein
MRPFGNGSNGNGTAQAHVQHMQELMAEFNCKALGLIKRQFARNAAGCLGMSARCSLVFAAALTGSSILD